MPRRKKDSDLAQKDLLNVAVQLHTAPCVPALREAVKQWRDDGYKGATDTTRLLLNYWFKSDHRSPNGRPFAYHYFQREAIETLIYVWEIEKVRSRKTLLERYAQSLQEVRLPPYDEFGRYCIKMATGSGKTKVMSLAVVWQFMNAMREPEEISRDYARTFLIIAPNVIVYERLKSDFAGGWIFRTDPLYPKSMEIFWDFDCVLRGAGERAHYEGMLFLTNIQQFHEARSTIASVRYKPYLIAGVERWKEYRDQLKPLKKKPVLFIMLSDTEEAEEVGHWLRTKYPDDFGGEKTLIIHTNKTGEITKADLDKARKAAREVDDHTNPINAIVSVLMLREGWDVQNVTVVVGLRPYSAKANILPEQTIGRGLRLMFRSSGVGYLERVDIIGNKAFLEFVDDLEKLEDLTLETFEIGKDKLRILSIAPVEEKKEFDIALPQLTPSLVRKKSLAEEIAAIDVMRFDCSPLPLKAGDAAEENFKFEGYDILTLKKILEREYVLPDPQTAQEIIGFYARLIAKEVKLPSQFAALAPKVREFFENKAFGKTVNLEESAIIKAMNSNVAQFVCKENFKKVLLHQTIAAQEPRLDTPARWLSGLKPIPWSRQVYEARKCVFNLVPCGNAFEKAFAKFLDHAEDVRAFSKLPESFAFAIEYTDAAMNLRNYYPDFVAVDTAGTHWLLETKGQQTEEVSHKDYAAGTWCENATNLTGTQWRYLKIMQKEFENLQPNSLSDLLVIR